MHVSMYVCMYVTLFVYVSLYVCMYVYVCMVLTVYYVFRSLFVHAETTCSWPLASNEGKYFSCDVCMEYLFVC